MLEEIKASALELAARTTQMTQQPRQQAQQAGHDGPAGDANVRGGRGAREGARLALQLRFDLELLAALFLPLGQPGPLEEQQKAAQVLAQQAQQPEQQAIGEVEGSRSQAASLRSSAMARTEAAISMAWALLYWLVGPAGVSQGGNLCSCSKFQLVEASGECPRWYEGVNWQNTARLLVLTVAHSTGEHASSGLCCILTS